MSAGRIVRTGGLDRQYGLIPGRPVGEIRLALQAAARGLVSDGVGHLTADGRMGVTWLQVAQRAQVGRTLGRRTVFNMASAGEFQRVGTVSVPGVCRPMTLFAPQQTSATSSSERSLDAVLRTWSGPLAARRG